MNGLSEGLRAALSPAMAEELCLVLNDLDEEAQMKEHTLNQSLQMLLEDIKDLERTRRTEVEERRKDRASLKAASNAVKQELQEQTREALECLRSEAQVRTDDFEKERQKRYGLERDLRMVNFQLELKEDNDYDRLMAKEVDQMIADSKRWAEQTKEKENRTLCITLNTVAIKQRLLKELKSQAEKWMVSGGPTQDSITTKTPPVFKTWRLREEWRKLQANKACLNDGLQSFSKRNEIERIIVQNLKLNEQSNLKFTGELERHMAEVRKKQDKIRAAELKERVRLEEQVRKDLQKIQKAELKEKQRQEVKERKEAEKREKKRAKEERQRTETRRSIFSFWRSSRASQN